MLNQVTNTTESFNCNFKWIFIAKIVVYGNKLFLRQVICSFLGFIDNLNTLFYKRNKQRSHCVIIEL